MNRSRLQKSGKIALIAAAAWLAFAPGETAVAKTPICPLFLTTYCVVNAAGVRSTVETNPCLARREHLRVLHIGRCQGPFCFPFFKPVCAINPVTHKRQTYGNECLAEINNATVVADKPCP